MQSEPDRRAAGAGGRRGPRGAVSTRLFPGTQFSACKGSLCVMVPRGTQVTCAHHCGRDN